MRAEKATETTPKNFYFANFPNLPKHLEYVGKRPYWASLGHGTTH